MPEGFKVVFILMRFHCIVSVLENDKFWFSPVAFSRTIVFMCSDMQDGWTALIHAAVSGKSDVVTELISLGADVDIQTNVSN